MRYFVLKPQGASAYALASRAALRAYAGEIEPVNPQLATDLREWAMRVEASPPAAFDCVAEDDGEP
jgi:hypothetical protein